MSSTGGLWHAGRRAWRSGVALCLVAAAMLCAMFHFFYVLVHSLSCCTHGPISFIAAAKLQPIIFLSEEKTVSQVEPIRNAGIRI